MEGYMDEMVQVAGQWRQRRSFVDFLATIPNAENMGEMAQKFLATLCVASRPLSITELLGQNGYLSTDGPIRNAATQRLAYLAKKGYISRRKRGSFTWVDSEKTRKPSA